MRINGSWLRCDDGVIRPIVQGLIKVNNETWLEVTFLLDAGADRTVFSSRYISRLRYLEIVGAETQLAGVGGDVSSIIIGTTLSFAKEDGQFINVRGTFGVFTEPESADLSVLGRDVTDNFSVIYDRPNNVVALLALPHVYEIKTVS